MNLGTINNQFYCNLPVDFIPTEIEEYYIRYLNNKRKLYKTVLDYLNSNIISISHPGINFPLVSNPQSFKRKRINYKSVGNVMDLFDDTITLTFKSVDSNYNYLILQDILINHYLNTDKTFDSPIMVTVTDEDKNALFHINYKEVIFTGISDNTFAFNDQELANKTFTMSFAYNYLEFVRISDDSENNNIITKETEIITDITNKEINENGPSLIG